MADGRPDTHLQRMHNALILLGHADPSSFNTQLAKAYADAWQAAGGSASIATLSDLHFDPVLRHGYREKQAMEPDLVRTGEMIQAAQHVVWVFPTYWASPPAVVRGFVDRLFQPGWAFRYPEKGNGLPEGLLRGRSARVIATMDSPSWWYALAHHRAIHGSFVTGTLSFVGFAPIRTTMIHSMRTLGEEARKKRLLEVTQAARIDLQKLGVPKAMQLTA
jgi:NAD(P)H dehydrogenase (quinone)